MFSLVILMATLDPDLVSLRSEAARAAWSMCLDDQMAKVRRSTGTPVIPEEAIVGAAMEQCYVFGQDVKRTLPDVVTGMLRGKGITSYSQGVVDGIVDGTFKSVEDELRREKLGAMDVIVPKIP